MSGDSLRQYFLCRGYVLKLYGCVYGRTFVYNCACVRLCVGASVAAAVAAKAGDAQLVVSRDNRTNRRRFRFCVARCEIPNSKYRHSSNAALHEPREDGEGAWREEDLSLVWPKGLFPDASDASHCLSLCANKTNGR